MSVEERGSSQIFFSQYHDLSLAEIHLLWLTDYFFTYLLYFLSRALAKVK